MMPPGLLNIRWTVIDPDLHICEMEALLLLSRKNGRGHGLTSVDIRMIVSRCRSVLKRSVRK